MAKIINGTNAADTITVKESDVIVNAGFGNDSINVISGSRNKVSGQQDDDTMTISGGSNSTFLGGSGKDTFKIEAGIGSGNKIYGEAGEDTMTINGGTGNYINGGGGVDSITFNGGSKNEFYAEREADVIHVYGGTENKICGGSGDDKIDIGQKVGLNNKIYGDGGKDQILVFGGAGNEIHGGSGSDIIKVTGGSSNVIIGDQDKDRITVTGGKKNKIYGGSGTDTLTIESTIGTGNYIYGEADEDTMTINGGTGNYINGGGDIDTVSFTGGSKNKFYGERGNDIIDILGGENNIICGGSDDDEITIKEGAGSGNKIYGDAGKDSIQVNAGENNEIHGGSGNDEIKVNGGSNNAIYGDKGNDAIEISNGSQIVDGGSGNDSIIVRGGSNHIIRGGTGSDTYTIAYTTQNYGVINIDQKDVAVGDTDSLCFQDVNGQDVQYVLKNGSLSITNSSGVTVAISDWQKNPMEKVSFADGQILDADEVTAKAEIFIIDWTLGNNSAVTVGDKIKGIRINGYKENDFVITLNKEGQLVLTDKLKGTIAVSDWSKTSVQYIEFSASDYEKQLTVQKVNELLFNEVVLADSSNYSAGTNERQEFEINFTTKTNVVIHSVNGAEDRIKFTDNHSVDDVDFAIQGNDLYLYNWSQEENKRIDGLVVIKDFKNSTVKTLEFKEMTYHLTGEGDHTFVGSDTFIDRYLFLDTEWSGTDRETGDWNVTVDGINGKDVLDFHFLPNNSRYYNLLSSKVGKDMVLTYQYATDPHNSATLGTVRLKDFYNEDGSINTANGYPRVRTNREIYAGSVSESAWDGWVWNRDKQYRWLSLNAGTAGEDSIDLRNVARPTNTKAWMYFAGGGNDTVTAQEGDIVYGGKGDDTVYVTGSWTDVHGGSGEDRITVQGAGGENLHHVVVRGDADKDVITAYGSYHYLHGGSGDDEINLRDDGKGNAVSQNNAVSGGNGDDTISIYAGKGNRVNGAAGNDTISIYAGNGNRVNGGAGNDRLVVRGGTESRLDGGIGTDTYSVEMDFNQNTHILIDQAGFVEGDTDILKLTKVIQSDMQFFLQNNVLKVAHVSGGNIEILGWNENPIEKIYFADGEITAAGINEKINS